jgi:hypothetical protein
MVVRGGDEDYENDEDFKPRTRIVIDYVMWIIQLVMWNVIVFLVISQFSGQHV